MGILVSLIVFSLIVIFHEFGHFYFAKRAGIYVEEFALFMGPKLYSKKIGETVFSIRAIPIGGFCQMRGEDDNSLEDDRAFGSKSLWQRFLVLFGGPFFNFIMALVFAIIYFSISSITTNTFADVPEDMPAYQAGIRAGDEVVSFEEMSVIRHKELMNYLQLEKGDSFDIGVRRDGKIMHFNVSPVLAENGKTKVIGVRFARLEDKGIFDIIKHAFIELLHVIRLVFYSLGKLITGQVSIKEMMGPVGLVSVMSSGVKTSSNYGFVVVLAFISNFIVMISTNLGVMNLLPLPALDGGRIVFVIYEAITRKRVNAKAEGMINLVGFALLMLLMVFIMYNDIVNFIAGKFNV